MTRTDIASIGFGSVGVALFGAALAYRSEDLCLWGLVALFAASLSFVLRLVQRKKSVDALLLKTTLERDSARVDSDSLRGALNKLKDEFTALSKERTALKTEQETLQLEVSKYADVKTIRDAVAFASAQLKKLESNKNVLERDYTTAFAQYKALKDEIGLLTEDTEDFSFGLYKPHFSFDTSERYKIELVSLRSRLQASIRGDRAATCPHEWTVGGDRAKGKKIISQVKKLMLRAFNGECESALANVNFSNFDKMEARIVAAYKAINQLGEGFQVSISSEYLALRIDELRLSHEYEAKKYEERELQRAEREKMRDELKAAQEIEQAKEEAESQEETYHKLLERARKEAAEATGAQLAELTERVATFEAKLDEARKKKERAIARAQLTKSGFVYVISNIGTFGEGVFKIGMTRRMEPMDRIAELSGASVPFPFDLHAMLYSDNAPELEGALHSFFDERRLNLVNPRKEFYHSIDLKEIEEYVKQLGISAQFVEYPEARQYRETVAKRMETQSRVPDRKFAETAFVN
jgi:hypothetical protein